MNDLSYANSFDHNCEKRELRLSDIRTVLHTIYQSNMPMPDEIRMHPIQITTLLNQLTMTGPLESEEIGKIEVSGIPVNQVVNDFSDEISFYSKGCLVARITNLAVPKDWI